MSNVCTRLHALGFPCEFDRTTADRIERMVERPWRRIKCPDGEYRVWQSPQGARIWFHFGSPPAPARRGRRVHPGLGPQPQTGPPPPAAQPPPMPARPAPAGRHVIDDLTGMTVFHRGVSDIRCRLDHSLPAPGRDPLSGICTATIEPQGGRRRGRRSAISFEHLGFAADAFDAPVMGRVQLLGLSQRIWAYPDERAYLRATPRERLIGVGGVANIEPRTVPDVGLIYRPQPGTLGLVTGLVRRSITLTNPVTDTRYVWMLLATERGDIDLLANPATIDGDISTGHVLQTVAVLAGRIIARA